ncbi:hypothetical protein R69658_05376 [Paraburkholderia aspalathi]|uniref:Holin of 3TMs, for gene-transfer release n=1 Tax=Paraburkholderia aspalathi TaxID=1324617 RepID=A0ABN7MPN4_9BURK|nr:hypothetical protein [Paraburkholderia aspalathi]MBK3821753.1 hypothetical protein [Paraburkholderia aspalathi]MBK3833643.1 hypothetical protein [Paraburkholderia aspalathi]MBK3863366.1 hypothetical protein [Paraburkholderia aspalathi]CAE6810469.1 hypothetical protein R69658_05376 [Paraburkholderia aspalathi]
MMDFLKTVAPWLVTALTGGVPGIAAMAASAIASKLGLADASVDAVRSALTGQQMTPEQLLALKQADDDFALKMRQAGFTHAENMAGIQVQADRVAADDRASARDFAAAEHDHTARNLAYMYTTALFAVIALEFLLAARQIRVDDSVMRALDTLFGILIAMVLGSKEYFFGSSSRADRQAAAITQFAVSPDTVVSRADAVDEQTLTRFRTKAD